MMLTSRGSTIAMFIHSMIAVVLLPFLVAPASSQELGRRVESLGKHFRERQRTPNFSRKSEILAAGLDETAATLDRLAAETRTGSNLAALTVALNAETERLKLLDREYQALFAGIESKLRNAGLESEIPKLNRFTAHYRDRMAALQHGLSEAASAGQISETKFRQLRASIHKSAVPGDTLAAAPSRPLNAAPLYKHVISQLYAAAAATDPPTAADLAENPVVRFTPEIRAKAAELGGSPRLIYQYVRNTVEFEPYLLLMQGSEAMHWSGRGSDLDIATYLIALLRASGTPARYSAITAEIPFPDFISWLGVKNQTAAEAMFDHFVSAKANGNSVSTLLFTVEAYTDTADGKAWVALDPSFKLRRFQPGIVVPLPLFDRTQYLNAPNTQLASHAYLDQFRATLARTNPGASLSDAAYTGTIVPDDSGALPSSLPYPTSGATTRFPDAAFLGFQHQVSVELVDPAARNASIVKATVNTADVLTHSLTVGFVAAPGGGGSDGGAVIDAFGGIENTPVFLLSSLTAQIRIDGRAIATGKQAVNLANLEVRVAYTIGPSTNSPTVKHSIFPGQIAAIVLSGHQATDRYIGSRIDNFLNRPGLASGDPQSAIGELLPLAGLRYFNRISQERTRLAAPLQLRYIHSYPDEAMVIAYSGVQNLFDRPFLLSPSRMVLDAASVNESFDSLYGGNLLAPELVGVRRAFGLTGSSLEHELWEELLLTPSVSTTKLLQLARSNGATIQSVTNANSATVLPQLDLPASIAATLRTDLAANNTILITSRVIPLGTYRGYGWISESSDGTGAYMIFGDELPANPHGGDSGTGPYVPVLSNPGPTGNPLITNGTACSDPVTVSNGNMFNSVVDFAISSRGPGFALVRTYNSLLSATDGPFGFGWTHGYNISVKESGSTITMTNGTGGTFSFSLQGIVYRSAALPQLTFSKDSQGFLLRHKNGVQSRFNTAGKLTAITDRVNNAMQFTYDSAARLVRVNDPLNRAVDFTYNAQGRITAAQDFTGRRTAYEYDAGGNLSSATDFAGSKTVYGYYAASPFLHLLKSTTTATNKTATYEYYADRKAARTVEPGGRTARFLYLPMRSETVVIDGRGFATSFFYNSLGNVTRIIKPDGNFADRLYTPAAQLSAFIDESGATVRYEYDALGNVTSITNPLGAKTQFTYEPGFNRVATARDPKGSITTFEYDASGNMTRAAGPLGTEAKFTYNSFGQLLTATNAEGAMTTIAYDDAGSPVKVTDPLGNSSQVEYDNMRRPLRLIDADGNERSVVYDVLGRVLRSINPLGDAVSMSYNSDSVLSEFTDAAGRVTRYGYDGLDNLNQVTDPAGNVTSYGFNIADCGCSASDNLVSYRDAAGQTSTLGYNSRDRLVSSTDSLGNNTRFDYDGRQNLTGLVNANGTAAAFKYDAAGRLISRTFPGGSESSFAYDVLGNLVTASNQHVTYSYAYDELNRLKSVGDSRFNKEISYAYDRLGRRTALTDTEGGIHAYAWDARNRVTSITSPSGAAATFSYDALRRRASMTYSNGVVSSYSYDAGSRLTSLSHGAIGSFAYTYDKSSNPLTVADASGAHAYQYDELNRLTAASHPSSTEESYSYDGAGNRLASAGDSGYSYDGAGRLVAAEGFGYRYDNIGNLVEKVGPSGTTTYSYDVENRLTGITFPDGSTAGYKYDPMGRRIEKNVNGAVTAYLYDGQNILLELDEGGSIQARYTHGPGIDRPLMMERGGQTYFYHSDRMGSIAALSGPSGAVVCAYRYDSFGKTQACADVANPYGFAGREYDAESGHYYLRARYYDPVTGRFISPDPMDLTGLVFLDQSGVPAMSLRGAPQHLNTYSYAVNNPMVFKDPMGLKGCSDNTKVLLGSTSQGYVVVTDRNGQLLPGFYGQLVEPDTGDPFWQIYESDTGLMVTGTLPLTEAERRAALANALWSANNPQPGILEDLKNYPSDVYHAYVDLGVTAGLVDQKYASSGYWHGRSSPVE